MAITVQGTINVYEAAREANVKRVVHFSSGCCQLAWEWDPAYPYGKLANGPDDEIPETRPMVRPRLARPPRFPLRRRQTLRREPRRYYSDKYGYLDDRPSPAGRAVLKEDRPLVRGTSPGFLSQSDLRAAHRTSALGAPESLKFDVFNAISDNKYRWRTTEHTTEVSAGSPREAPRQRLRARRSRVTRNRELATAKNEGACHPSPTKTGRNRTRAFCLSRFAWFTGAGGRLNRAPARGPPSGGRAA